MKQFSAGSASEIESCWGPALMLLMPFVLSEAKFPTGQLEITDMCIYTAPSVVTPISLRLPCASGVPVVVMETDQVSLEPRGLVVSIHLPPVAVKHVPLRLASATVLPLLALLLLAVLLPVLR